MKKINLPIAAKDSQKIDLSNTHIGTTDFFRPFLNYALECVPKDKLKVAVDVAVQGYPLAGPNLGQFTHHLNSFFVPFRTIMSDWVNFITSVDCRYFNYFVTDGSDGEPAGANGTSLIVGKRLLAPQISRTDLFYLFFPNFTSFNLSDVEGNTQEFSDVNAIPISDFNPTYGYGYVGEFTEDINPFVYKYVVNKSASTIRNQKPDVVGSLYFGSNSPFIDSATDDQIKTLFIGVWFTPLGRLVYQLIRSLGCKLPFGGYFKVAENSDFAIADFAGEYNDNNKHISMVSALPILALYKCFIDWYVPSKFKNDYDQMLQTMSMMQFPFRCQTGFNTFMVHKPYPLLYEVILYTQYPNDYFTNAYLYPNGSNSGESVDISLPDITLGSDSLSNWVTQQNSQTGITNTPFLNGDSLMQDEGSVGVLSSYALRALRALNNYVRRNQIVGYRAIDRFLAHFGANLDYTQTNRSIHIASHSVDIFPKVVIAQSDTYDGSVPSPEQQQALLGGKSANILFGNSLHHDFDTNEQGLFMVLSSVTPRIGYVQGLDRMFLHKKMDDFFIPEFDGLGVQMILKDELFSDIPSVSDSSNHSGESFGFSERYAEYKHKQDMLSGDFELGSRNAFLESLHTFRMFDKYPASINNEFLIGNGAEYDRIFMMSTSDYDHLQVVSQNKVAVFRRCNSVADVNDITDGSGQYMQTSVGGNHSLR